MNAAHVEQLPQNISLKSKWCLDYSFQVGEKQGGKGTKMLLSLNFYYDIVMLCKRIWRKQESKQDILKGKKNRYRCHSARQLNDNN